MTIRGKLSVAMLAMLCMLVLVAGIFDYAATTISTQALAHARVRELTVLTDDIRAEIFYQMAIDRGMPRLRDVEGWWPQDVLDDIGVRVNLATGDQEKRGWSKTLEFVRALAAAAPNDPSTTAIVRDADQQLRKLRREYDRRLADSVAATAQASSTAQVVVLSAALFAALLFAVVMLLVRDWLVRPIDLLNQAAEARGVVKSRNITVETVDESAGSTWPVDRRKLASAIGEIITNAAYHSKDGSFITISGRIIPRTNGTPSKLNIAVIDRGAGIHSNAMKRLFDVFYTTRPTGTGMGLPLAKKVITQHGGAIEVSSKLGEGTRMNVILSAPAVGG